jgi:hypothetical protein
MLYAQSNSKLCVVVAVSVSMVAGCARHEPAMTSHRYGSLKDDIVTSAVVKPRSTPRLYRKPVAKARIEAPALAASAEPAVPPATAADTPEVEPKGPQVLPKAPATGATAIVTQPPAGAEPPLPAVDDPDAVKALLAEGKALFDEGKVVQARRRFVAAINGPIPEALLALARTYDTYYLSRLPAVDAAPDMQRALVLYERALERGAADAAADLDRTRTVLRIPR